MSNALKTPLSNVPVGGNTSNWLKMSGNLADKAKSGFSQQKTGLLMSGIGNMLGDVGNALQDVYTKRDIKELGTLDPYITSSGGDIQPNPEYWTRYVKIMAAGGKGADGLNAQTLATINAVKINQARADKKLTQTEKEEALKADMMKSKNVRPAQMVPGPLESVPMNPDTQGPVQQIPGASVLEPGAQKIAGMNWVKDEKGMTDQPKPKAPLDMAGFLKDYTEVPEGTKNSAPVEVTDKGVTKTINAVSIKQRLADQGDTRITLADYRRYDAISGKILGIVGQRPEYAQSILKNSIAQNALRILSGSDTKDFVLNKSLATDFANQIVQLGTMGAGSTSAIQLIDDVRTKTAHGTAAEIAEYITSKPQEFFSAHSKKQLESVLKAEADHWMGKVATSAKAVMDSEDAALWKRYPELEKNMLTAINSKFAADWAATMGAKSLKEKMAIAKQIRFQAGQSLGLGQIDQPVAPSSEDMNQLRNRVYGKGE